MDIQLLGSSFESQTGKQDANPLKSNKVTCLYYSASNKYTLILRLVPTLLGFHAIAHWLL
jgi:hypothetical protein